EARDAAIDDDRHARQRGLQPIDTIIVERRDLAVLLRRQTVKPGLSGMHDQGVATGLDDVARELVERPFRILTVDADPTFHGDRDFHRALHRRDAIPNQLRLRHQTRAEAAVLHAIGGTADIEIDLVITKTFADPRGFDELARIGAAKLQRD